VYATAMTLKNWTLAMCLLSLAVVGPGYARSRYPTDDGAPECYFEVSNSLSGERRISARRSQDVGDKGTGLVAGGPYELQTAAANTPGLGRYPACTRFNEINASLEGGERLCSAFALVVSLFVGRTGPSSIATLDAQSETVVRGSVFDSGFGTAVAGATVALRAGSVELSAVSKPDGRYSILSVSPGHYVVTVTCPGFATRRSEITIGASPVELNTPIDVGLQIDYGPAAEVKGIVIDAARNPIAGATVVAVSPFDGSVNLRAFTEADGRYKLELPRAGQYVVYVSKEGFQIQTEAVITVHQPRSLDFT
jgi:hypothetical protein